MGIVFSEFNLNENKEDNVVFLRDDLLLRDFNPLTDPEIHLSHNEGKINSFNIKGNMSALFIITSPAPNTESSSWKM